MNNSRIQKLPIINASRDVLVNDIKMTKDPIRKIILKRFLDIKLLELKAEEEDPTIDGLSEDSVSVDDNSINNTDTADTKEKVDVKKEYEDLMIKQKKSLNELDNISRIKAYTELLEENKRDGDKHELEKARGQREKLWEVHGTYDPKYINYQKDDVMNNKLMERLNTEIDFRSETSFGGKAKIEKPFDNGEIDNTEMFARYEQTPFDKKKNENNKKTGQKHSLVRNSR